MISHEIALMLNRGTRVMTDDERRLLLGCATCILADLTGEGPSVEQQIAVLRQFLKPFSKFLREDAERMRKQTRDG